MKHVLLIKHNDKNIWKSFDTETEALEYADELHEIFKDVETIYVVI